MRTFPFKLPSSISKFQMVDIMIKSRYLEHFVVVLNGWHDARSPDKNVDASWDPCSLVRQARARAASPPSHHQPSTTSAALGSFNSLRHSSDIYFLVRSLFCAALACH
jgi:hypothetical protein